MGRITKIQQNSVDGQSGETFNIGATFDNVFMNPQNNFTLQDLYDQLDNFFNNERGAFTMYSNLEPKNTHVKVWYDTQVEDE